MNTLSLKNLVGHLLVVRIVFVVKLKIEQFVRVYPILLVDLQIVVQNVQQVRNVLVINLVLIHDVLIHALELADTTLGVVLSITILYVVVILDTLVIHSFNVVQKNVRINFIDCWIRVGAILG